MLESKSRTHSFDERIDLLIELAMERKNDSNMGKYWCKHMRRETPAQWNRTGRFSQRNLSQGRAAEGN